jgi:hypothetical protein
LRGSLVHHAQQRLSRRSTRSIVRAKWRGKHDPKPTELFGTGTKARSRSMACTKGWLVRVTMHDSARYASYCTTHKSTQRQDSVLPIKGA